MENSDRSEQDRRKFERSISRRLFFKTGHKKDNMEIWVNQHVEFHLDHIGFFHYISGRRVKGVSWDRAYLYEF